MCLYPKLIRNPKYKATKKNGGIIPPISDIRVTMVPIGCGNCMECRKQEGRKWQLRMLEDIKEHKNGKFVTLTFSNESIKKIIETKPSKRWGTMAGLQGYALDNEIATRGVRWFTERWRKEKGKSIRHWLITELGHNGTENIHLHGIMWTDESIEDIRRIWGYGYIYPGPGEEEKKNYVSEATVNYIIKYVTKTDQEHKYYKTKILTSSGIGDKYTETYNAKINKYNEEKETDETYKTRTGHKISMPIYWRNKIYTEEQREKLWLNKLDKNIRWVNGIKIDISKGEELYYKILEQERKKNRELGYGDSDTDWERKEYEKQRRMIMYKERLKENNSP